MKRRRTLVAIVACCVLERSHASPHWIGAKTGSSPSSRESLNKVIFANHNYGDRQRVAFLFSMIKRRGERVKDDAVLPLEQQEFNIIAEREPIRNGFSDVHANGAKIHDKTSAFYFPIPLVDETEGRDGADGITREVSMQDAMIQADKVVNGEASSSLPNATLDVNTPSLLADNTPENTTTSFKASLLTGLEIQTAAHRTRLLSDLLEGVKEGVMNAVDTEKEKIWFNEEKVRFWQFWRRGAASSGATPDNSSKDDLKSRDAIESSDTTTLDTKPQQSPNKASIQSSKFASRTITGLINALAQEVKNLEVKVDADPTTPLSNKTIHSIQIYFSRLGFQPLRMGDRSSDNTTADRTGEVERITADEAFDRIDLDQSGGLDSEELASALKMAAIMGNSTGGAYVGIRSKEMLSEMAARLVKLYDTNGDGVVDREEYGVMVRDMAFLSKRQLAGDVVENGGVLLEEKENEGVEKKKGWFGSMFSRGSEANDTIANLVVDDFSPVGDIMDVTENEIFWSLADQGEGSIVLKDLKLDLRRLLFGAIPVFKRVLPGGHLVLKPFTATVTASFNREDIMDSFLLDAGLRRLVARALSRRVRSLRDLFDGAVFYGRSWKLFEQNAPLVEVPKLQDVQFDAKNRLIITGRARIKAAPDAPSIENGFKLRTKIGTRSNGRIIGLLQPEIAVFAECPKAIESRVRKSVKDWFDYTIPNFEPLYTFIPLVSPFKKDDKMDGFNLGEDNQIGSIEIKDGKLCFEFSAILRPGRFLGSHYIAFTVPIRTLIVTLDQVKEGIRNARRNKKLADKAARERAKLLKDDELCNEECAMDEVFAQSVSGKPSVISNEGRERLQKLEADFQAVVELNESPNTENQKGFISRFVEGYSGARGDEDLQLNARLSSSISNFFGSQDSNELEQ